MTITYEEFLKSMPKFEDMKLWFIPGGSHYLQAILPDDTGTVVAIIDTTGIAGNPSDDTLHYEMDFERSGYQDMLKEEFAKYKQRPEFYAAVQSMNPFAVVSELMDNQVVYELILLGTAMIRAHKNGNKNPDVCINKLESCIKWLRDTEFYKGPASSRFHESFEGGLVHHTLNVVAHIRSLQVLPQFQTVELDSMLLCALSHDWCKIMRYEPFMKNVKNENTNRWEKELAYRRKDAILPLGHGVASMFLVERFFRLSPTEALAIRWHMGRWQVADDEYDEFQQANYNTPLVYMLQFADCLSNTVYGNDAVLNKE